MFFIFSLISMFGYSLQSVLLTKFAREMDGLSLSFYRNSSFWVSLLPFLFFVSFDEILRLRDFGFEFLFMGIMGTIKLWTIYIAYRYLPIGVVSTLNRSFLTVFLIFLGSVFFDEYLNFLTIFLICLIVFGSMVLCFVKNEMPHLNNKVLKGMMFTLIPAFPSAFSFFLMSKVSRELTPFVSGYFWEFSIGLFAILILILRKLITGEGLHKVSKKEYLKIAAASFPTFFGTGGLALAVSMGPIGVASGIGMASVVVSTLLAHYFYGEKLKFLQWVGILIVVCGIIGLKLIG